MPVCVGVSVPGTVDRHTGTVGFAPNLGWRDAAFGSACSTELASPHIPVVVGNDADLAVLAEHSRGQRARHDDVVFLMGRIGVGAGIIVNGAPLRGYHGHAGEIGHNVVDSVRAGVPLRQARLPRDLRRRSRAAGARRPGRTSPTDFEAGVVITAARAGDERACNAVRTVARSLGQVLGGLVNAFNPELILLGGTFAEILDIARPDVETALGRARLQRPGRARACSARAGLAHDSALVGAAEIAFAQLLADPLGGRALAAR